MSKLRFEVGQADINDPLVKKIINAIRGNSRALGYVATALKQTQASKVEEDTSSSKGSEFDFKLSSGASKEDKQEAAGIKAEETMFSYLRKVLTQFPSAILIPSITMEDPEKQLKEKGYIGDLDFVLIVGKAILIMDSKAMAPSKEVPYSIRDSNVVLATKIVREIHPGQFHVRKWAREKGFDLKNLSEYVVIMNNQETLVYKSPAWHRSPWKLFHITELFDAIKDFYEAHNDNAFHLDIISEMYRCHISAEKSFTEEERMRSVFKI